MPDVHFNDLLAHIAQHADWGVFNIQRDNLDVVKMASVISTFESAQYYTEHMLNAAALPDAHSLLTYAMEQAEADGMIVEFGVGPGNSLRHLCTLTDAPIYGFDSFDGLPEDWRSIWKKGAFKQEELPTGFGDNVELVQGLFADSLPDFCKKHKEQVRFLHMDCDLYSSTCTVFEHMKDRIVAGTVIVFDEYWNYAGWKQHEHKAFMEFMEKTCKLPFRYIGFVPNGLQVAVKFG